MLIVRTGSAIPEARRRYGDFDHWFRRAIGETAFDFSTVDVSREQPLPEVERMPDWCGVIVTGSPAMVSHRHAWSERAASWLAAVIADDAVPVLGVCYGHQLIAHALGGRVGSNPAGRRMGTQPLTVLDEADALLGGLREPVRVQITHLEAVLEPPPGARVIGRAEGDPHHALHFGGRCWGVQFHPEFDAAIMRCYVEARAGQLDAEGLDSRRILEGVTEAPSGPVVLERFARLCRARSGETHVEIA